MPLFLKALDPIIDILGNEQVLRYNNDQINNTANLLLLNNFTPLIGVFPATSLVFASTTLKGFQFKHELKSGSVYGDFSLKTYDKFGSSTDIFKYDELSDSFNFLKNVNLSGLTLSGNLSLNGNKITNLANGTVNTDGINLGQLNSAITGLGFSSLSNGLMARTASNTYASRNIAVGSGLGISNSDGVAGNPTLSLSTQLQNLHNLNTLGFISLSSTGTGSSSFVNRSLSVDSNLTITNGNGVSGNPLLGLASDIVTNSFTSTGGNVSATTGILKGNNLAVHNSGSISVLNSLNMNSNYINFLAYPLNNQDAATKQFVLDNSGGSVQSILHGFNNVTYSTNVSIGDHIKFDGVAFVRGSNISLDTTSTYTTSTGVASVGRITLAAGKTYKLTGSINNVVSANYNAMRWYNSDTNTALGVVSGMSSPVSTTDRVPSAGFIAYITTSVSTRVELRIIWNALSSVNGTGDGIGPTWFAVEEV